MNKEAKRLIEERMKEGPVVEAKGDKIKLHFDGKTFERYCWWEAGGMDGDRGDELLDAIEGTIGDYDDDPEDEEYLEVSRKQEKAVRDMMEDGITIILNKQGKLIAKVG